MYWQGYCECACAGRGSQVAGRDVRLASDVRRQQTTLKFKKLYRLRSARQTTEIASPNYYSTPSGAGGPRPTRPRGPAALHRTLWTRRDRFQYRQEDSWQRDHRWCDIQWESQAGIVRLHNLLSTRTLYELFRQTARRHILDEFNNKIIIKNISKKSDKLLRPVTFISLCFFVIKM